jgi:hypothetical protein
VEPLTETRATRYTGGVRGAVDSGGPWTAVAIAGLVLGLGGPWTALAGPAALPAAPAVEAPPPTVDPGPPTAAPAATPPPPAPGPEVPVTVKRAPMAPAPPESDQAAPASGWLDERRDALELRLGTFIDHFDHFFGADRRVDVEAPTSRFRFKTFVRTGDDKRFAMGFAVGTSIQLPRLERWLGNARLVFIGERVPGGLPRPPVGDTLTGVEAPHPLPASTDSTVPFLGRGRAQAELRFDLLRRDMLILDTGAGTSLVWPPVPFGRFRAHLRLGLGGGVLLRATDVLFVELWGRGMGTSTDVELARLLTPWLRLRWEGHGIFAQRSRGIEWSTLVGADWRVHPRTGLFSTAGCTGFGTPAPGVDVWRVVVGVRQGLWHNWIFAGLEPEVFWPRLAGLARSRFWAVTVRFEVVLDSQLLDAGEPL